LIETALEWAPLTAEWGCGVAAEMPGDLGGRHTLRPLLPNDHRIEPDLRGGVTPAQQSDFTWKF
jgi:hypothetical protein